MEIRHLVTFLKVAALHSFTKAGEDLGYSQANVSLQIRQLETDVGAPLFDRIGKKAQLTQYGQMLIPYAQRLVSTVTKIESLFRDKETLSGTLRIGFVESLFECLFQETVLRFHRQYPHVTVEIVVDAASELLRMLRAGQVDAVCRIDNDLIDPDVDCWATVPCHAVIVANAEHPLAKREQLSIQELEGQEFVMMEDTASYIEEFNRWLMSEHIKIKPFLKVQSPEGAIKVISRADYLSILPDYAVRDAVREGKLRQLNFNAFSQRQIVQFLVNRNRALTPQIEGFLREAYDTFLQYTGDEKN